MTRSRYSLAAGKYTNAISLLTAGAASGARGLASAAAATLWAQLLLNVAMCHTRMAEQAVSGPLRVFVRPC
jgi:hypothetical protein